MKKITSKLSPALVRKRPPVEVYREQLEKSLEKLTFEEVSLAAADFNLTTKLNQAAGFQYGKIESELGFVYQIFEFIIFFKLSDF